tara:strand:+ start:45 stop:671 length:627 start_codon:yes stop_codon:yes gene_type:complete
MLKMKKLTAKQKGLVVILSERGATWDNPYDRPYDICKFDRKIWTHDKKSVREAVVWSVGGMYAEPDYDVPLGKSPFNKIFATRHLAERKAIEKEVIRLLKSFRMHKTNAPESEEICYKIKDGTIGFWQNNTSKIEADKWVESEERTLTFEIDIDGGDAPVIVKFENFKKVVEHITERKHYEKFRWLLWNAIFQNSEPHENATYDGVPQ